MKTIYTSNYARIKQFTQEIPDAHVVATSCWVAHWHKGSIDEQKLEIAPDWDMVKAIKGGAIDEKEYERQYINLLKYRKINAKQLIKELPNNTFLLCFEKPTDFCHRHTLANWVYEQCGFRIIEWKTIKERETEQKKNIVEDLVKL